MKNDFSNNSAAPLAAAHAATQRHLPWVGVACLLGGWLSRPHETPANYSHNYRAQDSLDAGPSPGPGVAFCRVLLHHLEACSPPALFPGLPVAFTCLFCQSLDRNRGEISLGTSIRRPSTPEPQPCRLAAVVNWAAAGHIQQGGLQRFPSSHTAVELSSQVRGAGVEDNSLPSLNDSL